MDATNVKLGYEILDADGNGQRVAFDQLGIGYDKLLELQAKVIFPMVAALTQLTATWHAQAVAEMAKGNDKPPATPASAGGGKG